jgi:hypothetical protein
MRNIYINISDIPSFIGQNKWDIITPFERFWKRYDSIDFNKCINIMKEEVINGNDKIIQSKECLLKELNNNKITQKQYNNEMEKINDNENQIENTKEKIDNVCLSQSQKIENKLGKNFINEINNNNLSPKDNVQHSIEIIKNLNIPENKKNDLITQTTSFISKNHGISKEDSALSLYENKFKIKLDTSQKYYCQRLEKLNLINKYFIGGKMDGIYIDSKNSKNNYIVEVKNRTKGFFNSLRDYEKTQIQLYLLLLNYKKAKLVERYNNEI